MIEITGINIICDCCGRRSVQSCSITHAEILTANGIRQSLGTMGWERTHERIYPDRDLCPVCVNRRDEMQKRARR